MSVRVLLVVADDWIGRLLATALAEAGFVVDVKRSAKEAGPHLFEVDALVIDAGLRGDQATRILGDLRESEQGANVVAFVLCHVEDADTRLEALDAGADGCVNKPFRVEEVIGSLRALIRMRDRLKGTSASVDTGWDAPVIREAPSALSGDLEELSFSTILTMLEMERRSGVLTIEGARQTATVELAAGAAVQATLAGTDVSPIAVLRRVLRWKTGRFTFRSGQAVLPPDTRGSIGALLLEAAALEDEGAPSSLSSTRPSASSAIPPGLAPSPNTIATVRPAPFDAHETPTTKLDAPPTSRRPLKKPSVRPPPPPRPAPRPTTGFSLPRPPGLPDVEAARVATPVPRPGPPRPPPKRP